MAIDRIRLLLKYYGLKLKIKNVWLLVSKVKMDANVCESCNSIFGGLEAVFCEKCDNCVCINCRVNQELIIKFDTTITKKVLLTKAGVASSKIDRYNIDELDLFHPLKKGDNILNRWMLFPIQCPYCQKEEVGDEDLLKFVLAICGLSKEEAKTHYLESLE